MTLVAFLAIVDVALLLALIGFFCWQEHEALKNQRKNWSD